MRIRADRRMALGGAIELYGTDEPQNGYRHAVVARVVQVEPGDAIQPFAVLGIAQAQELMDDLWSCGLRPTEGTGSAGQSSAQQAHIDDLRKVTFKLLELNS